MGEILGLTSSDSHFLICNELFCEVSSIVLDMITLYSCQVFHYFKQSKNMHTSLKSSIVTKTNNENQRWNYTGLQPLECCNSYITAVLTRKTLRNSV